MFWSNKNTQFPSFLISAEFIIACQLFTMLNLFLTIISIRIFYKESSTPVPRWLEYLSLKVLRPMSFFKVKVIGKINDGWQNVEWKSIARIIDGFCFTLAPICMLVAVLGLFLLYYFS